MSTKGGWVIAAAAGAVLLSVAAAGAQTGACFDVDSCKVATDRPAAVVVYPKIVVDPELGVDTVIHLVNTSEGAVSARCSYVNANGHCSDDDSVCRNDGDCAGAARCVQGWSETDFRITLTRLQPLSWNASQGVSFLPCDFNSPEGRSCVERNDGRIPPVGETPFQGELKCIEVDDADAPIDSNDLVGEATTIRSAGDGLDASKYNAIGIQAIPGVGDHDNHLCLGGVSATDSCPQGAEYAGCPQTLIMDHFFEGASLGNAAPASNRLTLVPCSEDLLNRQDPSVPSITVQILIFNEFEQRTSTSFRFTCYADRGLADIDTDPDTSADDSASIFSLGPQGTPVGQTRISAVSGSTLANGLVGILEELRPCDSGPDGLCGAAVNLHQQGRRARSDIIQLP